MGDVDRRAVFFLAAAVACALLTPVADGYAWVAAVVAAVYVVLAACSWLDHRSRRNTPDDSEGPGRGLYAPRHG